MKSEEFGVRPAWLLGVLALYTAAFLTYAENWAFTWDESFHLLAAQLIAAGRRPYLDFCFPQTPFNAYWNAGWMHLLGENWRVPHAFAALFTIGAVVLTARFVYLRFPVPGWRSAAALTAGLLTGLNAMVFIYGPVAQAYGICLFALVVAYQIAVRSVNRPTPLGPAAAGFFAGVAAASSLLSAAAPPVLLLWMLVCNRAGSRWTKTLTFCLGAAIPFAPAIWLASQGPRQVWFNLVQYHLQFRQLYRPDVSSQDLETMTSPIRSGQAQLLFLLAFVGLVYAARSSRWPAALKAEFYLCASLAAALALESARANPTFARYFLLTVPFLAILASAGLHVIATRWAIAARWLSADRSLWAVLPVALLTLWGLGSSLYQRREVGDWSSYERLARKIDQVTPRGAWLFAEEPMYFLTRRIPPPGMELSYTHKIDLGPAENQLLHIVPDAQLKRELRLGMFATAYSCDEQAIDDYGLPSLYRQRIDMEDCSIFWDSTQPYTGR